LVRLKEDELPEVFHRDFKQLQQRNHELQKQNSQSHQSHTLSPVARSTFSRRAFPLPVAC
jgi:hypothetical protein